MSGGALWPQAILFDLDGTLADSFPVIQRALAAALEEAGMPPRNLDWVRTHVGRGAETLVGEAIPSTCEVGVVERVTQGYADHYGAIYLDGTPPLDGARPVLEYVFPRLDGRVGVVSNKPAELCRAWLEHWDLARYVGVVSGPDTSGALKPDAGAVRGVLSAFGVTAEQALMVGDMEIDAMTGMAVGMPVVIVRADARGSEGGGQPGTVGLLASLRGLPEWLVHNGRGWR